MVEKCDLKYKATRNSHLLSNMRTFPTHPTHQRLRTINSTNDIEINIVLIFLSLNPCALPIIFQIMGLAKPFWFPLLYFIQMI